MHLRVLRKHQCCPDFSSSNQPKCVSPFYPPDLPPGETQGEMHLRVLEIYQCCHDFSPSNQPECFLLSSSGICHQEKRTSFNALPDLSGFMSSAVPLFAGITTRRNPRRDALKGSRNTSIPSRCFGTELVPKCGSPFRRIWQR